MIGPVELLITLLIIVLLFTSHKLPGVMGDIGKAVTRFKQGMSGKDDPEDRDRKS
ncbi:MAG: twin-arginine translocase TatA/TatE family subunit [Alphaproteobacteria bacterium]|nr:twin-arginine translocase TatA/TatE family subunit [Alphaproteobacteria bacterium]